MSCEMSREDFDKAVKKVVDQEFEGPINAGLLTREGLAPIAEGMCETIHRDFPVITAEDAEHHLRLLRKECRETANRIYVMAKRAYGV